MVTDQARLDDILAQLKRVKPSGDSYKALCPAHDDHDASLSIALKADGKIVLKCFTGCPYDAIMARIDRPVSQLFRPDDRPAKRERITLQQFADHKRLPTAFLKQQGLHDLPGGGVGIPYRTADGQVAAVKSRTALAAKSGSFWEKGKPLQAYGLDRLPEARRLRRLVIVEGETDALTCWYHGFPCLGIPGADLVNRTLLAEHAEGIERIDFIQEPDGGGKTFSRGVAAQLGSFDWSGALHVVRLPVAKDPSELHQRHPEGFKAAFKAALAAAPLWSPEPDAATEAATSEAAVVPAVDRDGNLTKRLADIVLITDHFAQDRGGKLYVYRAGAYHPDGEAHIKRRVKALMVESGENWTTHRAKEVVEFIRVDASTLWDRPPLDTLNVANGLLNVTKGTLRPHSPDFLSPVQLPVAFDPAATCPHTDAFVATTYPEDAQEIAWEVFAWLMLPDTSIQKALLYTGDGSNGKSTALTQTTAFLGKANVASVSLQKLEGERFAAVRIMGKLANICPDLPSTHLADTSTFKAIVGGDWLAAEYKHRDGFDFLPFARLVFSANHPPQSADASHAFFRRWLVIPFERTFDPENAIPRDVLDARLSDPAELSGVLNRALEALPRLRGQGFTESASMRQAWLELRATTDPLAVWLDAATVEDPETFIAKHDLCRAYNQHCRSHGRPLLTENAFGRALLKLRSHLSDAQRKVGEHKLWVWRGLRLVDVTNSDSQARQSRESRDSSLMQLHGAEDPEEEPESERIRQLVAYSEIPVIPVIPGTDVDAWKPDYCRH